MKIESIKYEQLLPTGSYLNARYGIEISISEDNETDRAFELAKQIVAETHKKQFPAMYKDNTPIYQGEDALPEIQQPKKLTGIDYYMNEIKNCSKIENTSPEQLDGLEAMRTIADMNPKLKDAFTKRLKELQNG